MRSVNPFIDWREQGLHEWAAWKLLYTPIDFLFPTHQKREPTQEDLALAVIKEPSWDVLRRESGEEDASLNYTWVRECVSFEAKLVR